MRVNKISLILSIILTLCLTACTDHSNSNGGEPTSEQLSTHEHTFDNGSWKYDEEYHWHPSTCGHDVQGSKSRHIFNKSETNPTFESNGLITYTCSLCNYSYTEKGKDKLEHTYSTEWSHNEYNHWHACTDEGYEDLKESEGEHSFGEWVTDKEPTEYEEGSRYKICSICNYKIIEGLNKLEHTHKPGESHEENKIDATCTADGSYDLVTRCTECDEILSSEHLIIPSLDHNYQLTNTAPATFESDGVLTYVCSRCGDTYTEKGDPKLKHSYSSSWSVDTDNGTHYHACVDEGYEDLRSDEETHTFDSFVSPSTNGGVYDVTYSCSICGYSYIETQYKIVFETNGGESIEDLVAAEGDSISINPTRKGYSFAGWYTDPSLSLASYYELGDTMPAFNGTLYAKWSLITYTITYHLDYRTTNNPSNPIDYSVLSETITLLDPTVKYGTFDGWYTDKEFKNPITHIAKGSIGDLDIYAKETQTIYTITFVSNGGSAVSPISGTYGTRVVIPTPVNGNSIFVGWFTDPELTNRAYFSNMPGENVTLYAKWVDDMYTVFEIGSKQYMYFGKYPQSVVSDSDLETELSKITSTNNSGYYEYGGDEYVKIKVNAYEARGLTYLDGSSIRQYKEQYFKIEPILWRVFDLDSSGNYTLVTDRVMNSHRYGTQSSNYMNSQIRAWINDEFYNAAFNLAEKGVILTTNVDNSASTTDNSLNPYACENTNDKLFLLSYVDYYYGFDSMADRCCKTTDYATASYCFAYSLNDSEQNGNCYSYWTRSPVNKNQSYAWGIRYDGALESNIYSNNVSQLVSRDFFGVRPALRINIQ